MTRYILIDNGSGYIFADSANFEGHIFIGSPQEFARDFDDSIGERGFLYESLPMDPRSTVTGYHVYRAGDAVPVVTDGQDQNTIDDVTSACEYECFIIRRRELDD